MHNCTLSTQWQENQDQILHSQRSQGKETLQGKTHQADKNNNER